MNDICNLERFINAQERWYQIALKEIENGKNVKQFDEKGKFRVSRIQTIADGTINLLKTKWTNDDVNEESFMAIGDILLSHINSEKHLAKSALFNLEEKVVHGVNLVRFRPDKNKVNPNYLASIFKSKLFISKAQKYAQRAVNQASIRISNLKIIQIPLPPLSVQEDIVTEIEGYQRIIDGARLVVDNYKPSIKIDPDWEMVELWEVAENLDGKRIPITKSEREAGEYPYYGASGIVDWVKEYLFDDNLLLISEDGANLLSRVTPIAFSVTGKCWVNNHAHVLKFNESPTQYFVEIYLNAISIKNYVTGSAQPKLNQKNMNSIKIPLPPLSTQQEIVTQIEKEQALVDANKQLIEIYEQKIKDKISEVWGE